MVYITLFLSCQKGDDGYYMEHFGRPPGHNIMSMEEMLSMERGKTETRLYSKDEDADAKIRKLIAQATTELANLPEKVDIRDTEQVKSIVKAYMLSCYEAGSVPSKTGVCRSMGLSRQAIDAFMNKHVNHPSAEFLRVVFDSLAEILSSAALTNSTNMVLSIFLLKSIFGYKESVVIETPANDTILNEEVDAEAIARKYGYLPEE